MKNEESTCKKIKEELDNLYSDLKEEKVNNLNHCSECEIDEPNILKINSPYDAVLINTAQDGKGGFIPIGGGRDLNWEAGIGNTKGPNSVKNWIPAYVIKDRAWTNSIYSNANWISYYSNARQKASKEEAYFRIKFNLNTSVDPSQFFLDMKFFADNSVHEIYVNGKPQSIHSSTVLPQVSSGNPYGYVGFQADKEVNIKLMNDWQKCLNEVIVHVKSGAHYVGFLAQNSSNCYEVEPPNYKPSLNIKWGDSDCDCIESTDMEKMIITVCNPFSNISFSNYSIGTIEVFHQNGKKIELLPNGNPSIEVIPKGAFCFGTIKPCSCVSREFVLINNGAKQGKYRFKIAGICYNVELHYDLEDCLEFSICKD
ncbi:hypothetical protein [Polaribacter butkevichii]|uniref:Uncharacterized protein n=1 Tax=Polaribacter butkevichii TaxID=218490 RepID=A0A2P6CA45_9FLAO|nr:hypothetical protein [Polaribacter butkevichii]PQJ71786.1 hypothetical protein BTO14_00300 [Polaribacter butkevichii]